MAWPTLGDTSYSEDEDLAGPSHPNGFLTHRRVAIAALGLVGLVACGALVAPFVAMPQRATSNEGQVSVRALLESPELTDAMAENLVRIAGEPSARRESVRAEVAGQVRQVSADLREQHPALHARLEGSHLTSTERDATLSSMRKLSDPRMLAVGHALAEALGETMLEKGGREVLKKQLTTKLHPHVGNMRQLHDEIFPPALRRPGHEHAMWLGRDNDVDAERLTILKAFDKYLAQRNTEEARVASLRHLQELQQASDGRVRHQLSVFMALMEEKFDQSFQTSGFLGRRLDYTVSAEGQSYTYTSLFACVKDQFSVGMSGVFSCLTQAPGSAFDAVRGMFGFGA